MSFLLQIIALLCFIISYLFSYPEKSGAMCWGFLILGLIVILIQTFFIQLNFIMFFIPSDFLDN